MLRTAIYRERKEKQTQDDHGNENLAEEKGQTDLQLQSPAFRSQPIRLLEEQEKHWTSPLSCPLQEMQYYTPSKKKKSISNPQFLEMQ